ncbi:MAG: NADH:ubiquinone oxidoreductase subunit NDUFA12 [Alphaproteobacteria bacterium]|nr:NADH:ubiquinone oxidoreductase subunit NDUFA12 [Alphaproteobacteria bacterium]
MTLGTRLFTWLRGELVGTDAEGNRYYRDKKAVPGARDRRWVLYNGAAEASRVPAEWHGWLHHRTDALPVADRPRMTWQKAHAPNLTGTPAAYRPPGHVLKGGQRARATGDYEPWRPV